MHSARRRSGSGYRVGPAVNQSQGLWRWGHERGVGRAGQKVPFWIAAVAAFALGDGGALCGLAAELEFLRAEGLRIVNEHGRQVQLRGCNIGGWLLIEPWMLGIEGREGMGEKELWDVLRERFGPERTLELIRAHRENFFTEEDVRRIAGMGLNALRIPIWWRALKDPDYGGDWVYLDRCLAWCEQAGLYAILDLHGAPGGQNDNPHISGERTGADLWQNAAAQADTVMLWRELARRYKDRAVVAGYDVLNEAYNAPFDDLIALYDRLYDEIRSVDGRHIVIFQDGLQGFHRLPAPSDFGWENVVYSFHYYPQSAEEAARCAAEIVHRFRRAELAYGVPAYVGEFNSINLERGGADMFLRLCEVFDYYGWAWTFWSYKQIGDNRDDVWGVYGFYRARPILDLERDSYERIQTVLEGFRTEEATVRPLLKAALEIPARWKVPPEPPGMQVYDLRQAHVLRAERGDMRIEWQWEEPNVGYWLKGDTVAWWVDVATAGVQEIGITMANRSDANRLGLWLDGVHVRSVPLTNSGGWHTYVDQSLGCWELAAGRHTVLLSQDDEEDGFINVRRLWLRPAREPAEPRDEVCVELSGINLGTLRCGSPVRVEWLNDPPNIGFWLSRERVPWRVCMDRGGAYDVSVCYSTPHEVSRFRLYVDGQEVCAVTLRGTGAWHAYRDTPCGRLHLQPGAHTIEAAWEIAGSAGAGNLRSIRLARADGEPSERAAARHDGGEAQEATDASANRETGADL